MAALVCFARFLHREQELVYTSVLAKAIVPDLRFPSRHKAAPGFFSASAVPGRRNIDSHPHIYIYIRTYMGVSENGGTLFGVPSGGFSVWGIEGEAPCWEIPIFVYDFRN